MNEWYKYGWSDPRAELLNDYDWADPTGKRVTPDRMVRMILAGEVHRNRLASVIRFDLYHAQGHGTHFIDVEMVRTRLLNDDNIYRVSVFSDGVDVISFGLSSVDSDISGHYDRSDDLPQWVQERLAVLMITSSTPPTQEVEGVGRRISSHVYWVYAPERT